MTRKLTKEEHDRLGLTARQIRDLRLTDEWLEEELSRMMAPRRMSDADRAEWVREETKKRKREGAGIAGGWQWIARENPPRSLTIEQAIAWASDRACALDQESEERAALIALLEGVGAGATFLKRLNATQEAGGAYLRGEIGKPELRGMVFEPEKKRGNPGKKSAGTPRLDALDAGRSVDEIAAENNITPAAAKKAIQAEAKSVGRDPIKFPRKSGNQIRRN